MSLLAVSFWQCVTDVGCVIVCALFLILILGDEW